MLCFLLYIPDVRQIYSSVTASLSAAPDRKFIAVETSFFSRWFNEQNETEKQIVRKLVGNGRKFEDNKIAI
jgi:lysosomal alpha-mannosidase